MTLNPALQFALTATDLIMAAIPRKKPSRDALRSCKIISHRGEHDNRQVHENTMEAFRIARNAKAWGIETDIRWTRDLVPMIHHDADTARVFGTEVSICDVEFAELREKLPQIPTLAELVEEFGGNTHLMIELKEEHFPELEKQREILSDHLSELEPQADYHILSLDPALFEQFDVQPRKACLPVAMTNARTLSDISLERGYAGISGHFVLLNNAMKRRHDAVEQVLGTGFPTSRNALYREINRGIPWIFTNHAVKLMKTINNS